MRDQGSEIVGGANAVYEMLVASPKMVLEVLVEAPMRPKLRKVASEAERAGVPVRVLEAQRLRALLGGRGGQGVAAVVRSYEYASEDEVLEDLLGREAGFAVALDCVQDPQNLGAIIRCAAFFGACGVLLPKRRSVGVTSTVMRVSAGAASRVRVARVTNLARTLGRWREEGIRVIGAVAHGGVEPKALQGMGRDVLVLGSEHEGLRRLVREACDLLVTIPSRGGFESLNVAVAAGVLMYALGGGERGD